MSHAVRAHARLAPSSAHRWMRCPGSVRLSENIPNRSSVFADEGTAAHMLAEHCLESGQDAADYGGAYVDINEGAAKFHTGAGERRFLVDEEMADGVQMYLDYVRDIFDRCDFYALEERVDLTHLHPDFFGTGDASGYEEMTEHLHAIDFKYGKNHAVDVDENEQLLSYASGFVRNSFAAGRPVRKVTVHIVQPRAHHPDGPKRKWSRTLTQLRDFDRKAAEAAAATDKPDAPLVTGEHCEFCPARAICPARRAEVMANAGIEFLDGHIVGGLPRHDLMASDELGSFLPAVYALAKYCDQVIEFAMSEAGDGRVPTGFKQVAKRAYRKWKDEDRAAAVLRTIFDLNDQEIFTRKMLSPAAADKIVGKAGAKQLVSLQSKESSGWTLAPLDDPREPIRADPSVEFGGE